MFDLDAKSSGKLGSVKQELQLVVNKSTKLYDGKFAVYDALRTLAKQKSLVASGASKTMDSRHLTGHAVDIVPIIDGQLKWDWPELYKIAECIREAAIECKYQVRWGGCWDLVLNSTNIPAKLLVKQYSDRCYAKGEKPFLDGAHFELYRGQFP
jgi:peptidoglycan L-alanyl-D-glutamate endopeptidase CwlK